MGVLNPVSGEVAAVQRYDCIGGEEAVCECEALNPTFLFLHLVIFLYACLAPPALGTRWGSCGVEGMGVVKHGIWRF